MTELRKVLVAVLTLSLPISALAQAAPAAPAAPPTVQVYGTLNVNLQYTRRATPPSVRRTTSPPGSRSRPTRRTSASAAPSRCTTPFRRLPVRDQRGRERRGAPRASATGTAGLASPAPLRHASSRHLGHALQGDHLRHEGRRSLRQHGRLRLPGPDGEARATAAGPRPSRARRRPASTSAGPSAWPTGRRRSPTC